VINLALVTIFTFSRSRIAQFTINSHLQYIKSLLFQDMFTELGNSLFKQIRYSHVFARIKQAPPDKVFGMVIAFDNDKYPKKVNLGLGAYKD